MTLVRGTTGTQVRDLQLALLEVGEPLPRFGADGSLGDETLSAIADLVGKHLDEVVLRNPNAVSDAELAFVFKLRDDLRLSPVVPPIPDWVDRRRFAGTTKDGGPRAWDKVKGWCLHQTACTLSASPHLSRCDGIGAHYVVYPDGRVFQLHDINRIVWHGNGWNAQTIGIEIDGLFAGIEGDATTVWDDPSTPQRETATSVTVAQIEAVKRIIRADFDEIVRHRGKPTVIVAHRQSSGDRRNDPGSKIWQEIAIPMLAELKLNDGGPGFKLDDGYGGRAIPEAWDPTRKGIAY